MNSVRGVGFQFLFIVGFIALSALTSNAQDSQKPLFVIKSPDVEKSHYGKDFSTSMKSASFPMKQEQETRESSGNNSDLLDDEMLDKNIPETEWELKPMSSITPRIRSNSGMVPEDRSPRLTNLGTTPLSASYKVFAWAAPNINYEPLFFEDVALERYGQSRGLFRQPFTSAVHYLKSATLIPYTSFYDPIDSCDYPLGYARPGDCTDCIKEKHFFGNPFRLRKN